MPRKVVVNVDDTVKGRVADPLQPSGRLLGHGGDGSGPAGLGGALRLPDVDPGILQVAADQVHDVLQLGYGALVVAYQAFGAFGHLLHQLRLVDLSFGVLLVQGGNVITERADHLVKHDGAHHVGNNVTEGVRGIVLEAVQRVLPVVEPVPQAVHEVLRQRLVQGAHILVQLFYVFVVFFPELYKGLERLLRLAHKFVAVVVNKRLCKLLVDQSFIIKQLA